MSSRRYPDPINYGEPMGSSSRETHYPDRAARRAELRAYGSWKGDALSRKPFFACGEARKRGWMAIVWDNPYMREIVRKRLTAALAARTVLPLPGGAY